MGQDAARRAPGEAVERISREVEGVPLPGELEREVVRHAARLALLPRSVRPRHLDALRSVGLDDRAIHDLTAVAACFAFMNRMADGLGVLLDPSRHGDAVELFGPERLAAHLDRAPRTDPGRGPSPVDGGPPVGHDG